MSCIYFGQQAGDVVDVTGCCGETQVTKSSPLYACNSPEQPAAYCIDDDALTGWMPVVIDGTPKGEKVSHCGKCPFKRQTEAEIAAPVEFIESIPVRTIENESDKTTIDDEGVITVVTAPAIPGDPIVIVKTIPAKHQMPSFDPEEPFKPLAQRMWEENRRKKNRTVHNAVSAHPSWDSLYCVHRGQMTRTVALGQTTLKVLNCHIHGECTVAAKSEGIRCCAECPDRAHTIKVTGSWPNKTSLPVPVIDPLWRKRLPITNTNTTDRIVLNNSIIEFQGQLWMAYRNRWSHAELRICRLNENYGVVDNQLLDIPRCTWNAVGCEDPRLFVYNGHLHVAFTGVESRNGLVTHVMYARLTDDGKVQQCYLPHFSRRHDWEKNWSMFAVGDKLFCEYAFNPRVILAIDEDVATMAYEPRQALPDIVGSVRGGSSPVLWDNEWYSFHHHVFRYLNEPWYAIGLHTFENKPPFRLSRVLPGVLLVPTQRDRPARHVPHVVYPCGAVNRNNQWVVSFGYYDRWCELAGWDVNELEALLQPVPGGVYDAAFRPGTDDTVVWRNVYVGNGEYQLPTLQPGDSVVDVGAHIGSFSRKCTDAGAKVVAIEANAESMALCRINAPRAEHIHAAACGDSGELPERIQPAPKYPSGNSGHQGAELVPLGSVLKRFPIVRLLKLDCEGAEYWICRDTDLSNVVEIIGEAHEVPGVIGLDMNYLQTILSLQGFLVSSHRPGETWLFRAIRDSNSPAVPKSVT